MKIVQHSEWGQDRWAIDMAGPSPSSSGFFIDSNSGPGVFHSNTFLLESQYGWRGICIDNDQANIQSLKDRRRCQIAFVHTELLPAKMAEMLRVFGAPKVIDYWSVNAPGAELELLDKFPWSMHKVTAISIKRSQECRSIIHEFLTSHGYFIPFLRPTNDDGYYTSYA